MLRGEFKAENGLKAYAFGSVLAGGSGWADVDILVVIMDPEDFDRLKKELAHISATVPLHLTVVLHSEFCELGVDAWGVLHDLAVF